MISGACRETHHSAQYGERQSPCLGHGPMYFLDSVNMDGPVVAKQSEVGISYSGSVQLPSVPKKHLNIPNVVPQL